MHLPSHAFNVVPRKLIEGNFQERPGLVSPGFTVVPRNIIEGNSSQRPGLVSPDHSLTQLHVAHRYRHTMLQVTYWLYILTLAHGAWAQGRSHPFNPIVFAAQASNSVTLLVVAKPLLASSVVARPLLASSVVARPLEASWIREAFSLASSTLSGIIPGSN